MKIILGIFLIISSTKGSNWSHIKVRDIKVKTDKDFIWNDNERIVGGLEALLHQAPYQAALLFNDAKGNEFFCGGSLISRNYILTAAHCVEGMINVKIILGAHNIHKSEPSTVKMTSQNITIHEHWNGKNFQNDIALIKLPQTVNLDDNVQLITLPSHNETHQKFVGSSVTVSGWGRNSDGNTFISDVLHFVTSTVITNLKCSPPYFFTIRKSHLCMSGIGGKSSCNGDSGGPLTTKINEVVKQIGIVSFGSTSGCEKGFPSVYTRITNFLDWIQKHSDVIVKH